MSRNGRRGSVLADPSRLSPRGDDGDDDIIRVVVETPKGSRNKYAFDPDEKVFELKKVLPAGMGFPYDFGFIPSTKGEDGDPVDALVLMDEPAFTGCVLKCRIIGIIEGTQSDKEGKQRNDRIVAIEQQNHSWAGIKRIEDLGKQFLEEIENFFVNYHKLSGADYRVIGTKGRGAARKCVEKGLDACRRS